MNFKWLPKIAGWLFCIVAGITPAYSQAPHITYNTPQTYIVGASITPLVPANTGGAVPANAYGRVSTFAGTGQNGATNGAGIIASFSAPYGIIADKNGNLFVSEYYNPLVRKITSDGIVSTYAGNGTPGAIDGPLGAASFDEMNGITIDADGNLYIADSNNKKIRKITPQGMVSTYAGSGLQGAANGAALMASFANPTGVTVDASGNMYVADQSSYVIKKISPSAIVYPFAGSVNVSNHLDGQGAGAQFVSPVDVKVDADGNVYTAEVGGYIRKITPSGSVNTIAGNGTTNVTDGPALLSGFSGPLGLTLDALGNIYVADTYHNMIRKIDLAGNISTVAGNITSGNIDGVGKDARFFSPTNLTIDINGNLFVTDKYNNSIRRITLTGYTIDKALPAGLIFDPNTGSISGKPTVAGPSANYTITAYNKDGNSSTVVTIKINDITPEPPVAAPNISYQTPQTYIINTNISPLIPANTGGAVPANEYGMVSTFAGDSEAGDVDAIGLNARFKTPEGLAIDKNDNIYVGDALNHKVRKITPAGEVSTLAGSGTYGNVDGLGTLAMFDTPASMAVDNSGTVYLADLNNNLIKKISPAGLATTFAGDGSQGTSDGQGVAAGIYKPNSVTFDVNGNLIITDNSFLIRRITTAGYVSTVAGSSLYGTTDGYGIAASFAQPGGAVVDKANNIYVVDSGSGRLRKIAPDGLVTTVAGSSTGYADGTKNAAKFNYPGCIAIDRSGNLFVTDVGNNRIRRVTPAGEVTTFAGNGLAASTNGTLLGSSFNYPYGIVFNSSGNMFVSEIVNNTIRELQLTGYTIDKALPAGLIFDSKTGIISGKPTVISPVIIYTVTAYNAGGSSSTAISIKVVNMALPPAVITFPAIANKNKCDADFPVNVTSTNLVTPITYTSSNPAVATISATGMIHITGSGTTNITASQAGSAVYDPALPVSKQLTVAAQDIPVVTISPDYASGCEGMTITFTATTNTPNVNYKWQINGANTGTNSPTLAVTTISKTDVVTCTVTTTDVCPASALSNTYSSISLDPYVTPLVSIQSSAAAGVCSGAEITFTATTENEGTAPIYQWIVNNVNVGENSKTFKSSTLNNGDIISFNLTNIGGACLTTLFAYSNNMIANIIPLPNPAPSVNIIPSVNNVYAGTSITFTAAPQNAGPSPQYQWKINDVNVGANSPTFTSSSIKDHDRVTCTLTVNINCTYEVTAPPVVMNILIPPAIIPPNTFTPNGDGINDTWTIANLINYPGCQVYIYNRAGTLVMESKGYNKAWDGTYQGKTLPVGVYYYIIDLKNGTRSVSGNVTILR